MFDMLASNLNQELLPISGDEQKVLMTDYRKSVSPKASIVGCSVCGEKIVVDEGESIEKYKIQLSKLACLLVDSDLSESDTKASLHSNVNIYSILELH